MFERSHCNRLPPPPSEVSLCDTRPSFLSFNPLCAAFSAPRARYKAGVGGVITGWDRGLLGASVGETRKLNIPAAEGYGAQGFPAWGIPPNGALFFEIEVLSIAGKEL